MFTLTFSVAFAVVAVFAMGIGALKGKKTVWQMSVTKIFLSVVSAIIAALVSAAVSKAVVGVVIDALLGDLLGELMAGLTSGQEIITALVAMIVAPFLFLPFYAIIKSILKIFKKMIARPFRKLTTKKVEEVAEEAPVEEVAEEEAPELTEKEMKKAAKAAAKEAKKAKKYAKKHEFKLEKSNWISALCGALCSLVTLCIILIPAVGGLGIINDIAALPLQTAAAADESGTTSTVAEVLDGAANNAGSVTVKLLGGQLIYDMMTTCNVGGETTTLRTETKFVQSIANVVIVLGNDEADKAEQADSLRGVADAFADSSMMPVLLSEITTAAADSWRNGEEFAGLAMPDMGPLNPVMMSVVEAFAQGNVDTIKEDMRSIVEIFAVLVENDAMESFGDNPLVMLSKEQTTAKILKELIDNPRLCVMVDGLSDFGMSLLLSSVGVVEDHDGYYDQFKAAMNGVYADEEGAYAALYADVFDAFGLKVSDELCADAGKAMMETGDINAWIRENIAADEEAFNKATVIVTVKDITDGIPTITNKDKEAEALAHCFAVIYGLTDGMGDSSFEVQNLLADMGAVLDSFAQTETYGVEKTGMILKAMLQSEMVHDEMGFSIMEATDAADSIIKNASSKGYVSLLASLAKVVEAIQASSDLDVSNVEKVEAMLKDLTPETAEVLASIATPQVMMNYGVKAESAKPVSDLMGNTFTNLADAKANGMSDEDYAKESAAVSNMMNMVMDSGDGAIFGDGSSTGTTADKFVSDITGSQVISQTLVETVYGDGEEATNDPLKTGKAMSDEEKADFVGSLNNEWNNSAKSAEDAKEIIAIGAIMNVAVEIGDDGVVAK